MRNDFPTHEEARAFAQAQANAIGQSYGIEKTDVNLPGWGPWLVKMIPNNKSLRFGWEARCEAVDPETLRDETKPMLKSGRMVVDPQGRMVEIKKAEGDEVTVKLGGSYGATVKLPASTLRAPGGLDQATIRTLIDVAERCNGQVQRNPADAILIQFVSVEDAENFCAYLLFDYDGAATYRWTGPKTVVINPSAATELSATGRKIERAPKLQNISPKVDDRDLDTILDSLEDEK